MYYKRLFEIDSWKIIENKLHKEDMRLSESITSIGNGHMGLRGNFEEKYSGDSHQGTYIGGVWFPDKTRVGWWKNGYPNYFGKVINATNFIGIDVALEGEELDLFNEELDSYYRELDMKNGILKREFVVNREGKKTKIQVVRFLSLEHKELAVVEYKVTPLNWNGKVSVSPYLDGNIRNEDSNYDEHFWDEIHRENREKQATLIMKTKNNPFETPQYEVATSMMIEADGYDEITTYSSESYVQNSLEFSAIKNSEICVRKYIAVTTSRDHQDTKKAGYELLNIVKNQGFDSIKNNHMKRWEDRWNIADVEIQGDDEAQQGIRFNLFQLFSTYYGEDSNLNIGPKGFTGEKYGGATYWDTEAYALPLYLAISPTSVPKNLLEYRHNQLEGAYHNARQQGLRGALYPMVTFTGVECHNEWEITFEEIHRNGAIAYGIYNYTTYTGDFSYVMEKGIDVLLGISRFWADRVHYNKKKDKYMIHGVTGPNEYENNVNNNWYTNYIASWTLQYTMEILEKLKGSAKLDDLQISKDEISKWNDIVEKMYYPYDEELGVFVQHDTFLDKDLRPASSLDPTERPLNQKWSWDKILRSCFIKQGDVLQGLYFFNDKFTLDEKKRNFEFYEPMTVHESSLSPCIHSILAAELKFEEKAVEMYQRTARLDLDNYNNDTEDGLHITSMTGSWLSIVHGFAGMRTFNGQLSFAPFLPKNWSGYSFKILYRGRLLKITTDKNNVVIELKDGEAIEIMLYNEKLILNDKLEKAIN